MILLLRLILILTIFIVPITPNYFGFGFESIKVLLFISLNIISGLIFIYLLQKKKLSLKFSKLKTAGLVFLITLTLTSVSGVNFFESLMGRYPYYQGLILYWFLFLFFLMVSEVKLELPVLSRVISYAALVVGIVAGYQFILMNVLGLGIPAYAGRVVSSFGQPNFYSGFLLLSLPFSYMLFSKSLKRVNVYLLILIISMAGIVISFSRTAIFLGAVIAGFYFLKALPKVSRVLLVLLLVCVISIFASGSIFQVLNSEIIEPRTNLWLLNNSPEKRILIWPVVFDLIVLKPVFGYGLDNLGVAFTGYLRTLDPVTTALDPAVFTLKSLSLDRSHNYILDILVFSGVAGLAAYLMLLRFMLINAGKSQVLLSALILYLVWVQFQNQSLVQLMMFWAVAGVTDKSEYSET